MYEIDKFLMTFCKDVDRRKWFLEKTGREESIGWEDEEMYNFGV